MKFTPWPLSARMAFVICAMIPPPNCIHPAAAQTVTIDASMSNQTLEGWGTSRRGLPTAWAAGPTQRITTV